MPPAHPVRTIDMRHATLWVYRHTAVLSTHRSTRTYSRTAVLHPVHGEGLIQAVLTRAAYGIARDSTNRAAPVNQ